MRIVISYHSGEPIYEQIKAQLKAQVLSGDLAEGEALPSIRQLARDLKVSVITTTRAYGDLELEGFIATVPGKGCYVRAVNGDALKRQYAKETREALAAAARAAPLAGLTFEDLANTLDALMRGEKQEEGYGEKRD
ncbi:MAG: GntR family transcriptional regulator [Oscillospiraceae bacterium]|jgi:GntR family transcriptional regulator|nr:GntR family transcriptional regulator [Oscillospiraceae bacterium]